MAKLTVLVADPSEKVRRFAEHTLSLAPHQITVLAAGTVAEAARLAQANAIDIAFAGTEMETQRGQRMIFRMLKDLRPRPYCIGLAPQPVEHPREFMRMHGVQELIVPPLDAFPVLAAIESAVQHNRVRQVTVIDPGDETRNALVETLRKCQFRLDIQSYAELGPALDDLDIFANDIVIANTDKLPGADHMTIQEIQKVTGGTSVLVMSADRDPKARLRARAAGAAGFLPRPFLLQDLEVLLAELPGIGRTRHKAAA